VQGADHLEHEKYLKNLPFDERKKKLFIKFVFVQGKLLLLVNTWRTVTYGEQDKHKDNVQESIASSFIANAQRKDGKRQSFFPG